jgi:hypothetical protein
MRAQGLFKKQLTYLRAIAHCGINSILVFVCDVSKKCARITKFAACADQWMGIIMAAPLR